jgi:peptide/nickel transport system substrate-binding protein
VNRFRIAVLALALITFLGCGPPELARSATATSTGPVRGGTLVVGSITDVDSWNPYVSQQAFAGNLLGRIFLPLAAEAPDAKSRPDAYVPALAESWALADDKLALTFTLREATWSDGRPITSQDVAFTFAAQRSRDVPWTAAASKELITAVETPDPRTVVVRFARQYPYQLADAVEGPVLPEHVFGQVPLADWATHDWSDLRVGSGPFVLARHAPGQEIELERNPRYGTPERPYLDRIVVRIVPDVSSLVTQLMAGDIDYVEGVPPRDAKRLDEEDAITVLPLDLPQYDFIGWNGARPPFDDPAVRRALTQAIDRESLVSDVLFGLGRVSKGPAPSAWWGASPKIEPWPYDPDAARTALAARGIAVTDARGARGPGRPLAFELLTNAGNRLREDVLLKVQEQLARIGVEARVRPLEMKTMRQLVAAGEYDAYLGGWVFSGKIELKSLFGSMFTPPNGLNVVAYRSPQADRMLAWMDKAPDVGSLVPLVERFQDLVHQEQPYTFLYENQRVVAYRDRLRGVTVDVPSDSLARIEEFWIAGP